MSICIGSPVSSLIESIVSELEISHCADPNFNFNSSAFLNEIPVTKDISLLKFIHDFTSESLVSNVNEFNSRGLLQPQDQFGGVPKATVQRIEILFNQVEFGADPEILKKELDRWGLFDHYEERFLNLFK